LDWMGGYAGYGLVLAHPVDFYMCDALMLYNDWRRTSSFLFSSNA